MFRTVEIGKRRFRIVHDCKAANDAVDSPPQVAFDSIAYIRSLAGSYSCAACFDMTSYFHQFSLAPECRNQFAFRVDESWFRPTRAPMGFKKSVDVAQATTTYLAKSACCEDVVYSVIIDNVIFCSNSYRSLQATCMRFQSICDAFNVTIGESTGICTQVTFRGICLDFRQRVITLAQKFRFKLLLKFFLYENASSNTWGEARSLIGSFVYVATARGTPLAQIYALLKCAARNVLTSQHPFATRKSCDK